MKKIDINILLVDDEVHLLNALQTILSKFIKKVHGVTCSKEGLDFFNNNRENIDLIITDLNMPNMNGFELISKVRENCKNTVIYLSSGEDDIESSYNLETLNIKRKLLKPTAIEIILDNIKKDFL